MSTHASRLVMWFVAGLAVAPLDTVPSEEHRRGIMRAAPSGTTFAAWRAGHERAGNALFLRYRRQLEEMLRRATGRRDVDDDVQDVLVAVLSNRAACATSSRFEEALLDEVDRIIARGRA